MHNGAAGLSPGSQQQQQPQASASPAPPPPLPAQYTAERESSRANVGRVTPQPQIMVEDMSNDEVTQLVKDHKELSKHSCIACISTLGAHASNRGQVHKGEKVLLRQGRPGKATSEQSCASAPGSIAHITRRQRICHPFQSTRRPDRAACVQYTKELEDHPFVAGDFGQQRCDKYGQTRDDGCGEGVHFVLVGRRGF